MAHKLQYENPRHRIRREIPILGLMSVLAGIGAIAMNACMSSGMVSFRLSTLQMWAVAIWATPAAGVICGISGIITDPRKVWAWFGLIVNSLVLLVFGLNVLNFWYMWP